MQFFLGLFFAVVGPIVTVKADKMLEAFGAIPWAEEHLGSYGGSRFFYRLLGILLFFLGLMMMFNLFNGLLYWLLSPILPKQP